MKINKIATCCRCGKEFMITFTINGNEKIATGSCPVHPNEDFTTRFEIDPDKWKGVWGRVSYES